MRVGREHEGNHEDKLINVVNIFLQKLPITIAILFTS